MIVVKGIKPGKPFQSSIYRKEVIAAANSIKQEMLKDFKSTTKTWTHQPTFGYKVDILSGEIRIQIATDDPVYGYVDEGTRPHIIRPKNKKALAFRGGKYRAKTKVKVIGSTAGGPSGAIVVRPVVHHPGTKAREFTQEIAKKWKPKFNQEMNAALKRFKQRTSQ